MDFILDFETLDTKDSAVLLSVGLLAIEKPMPFNELINEGLHIKIDRTEQLNMGRTVSADTVNWWKSQNESAKDILSNNNITPVAKTLYKIREYFKEYNLDKKSTIWSRGLIDQRWLQHIADTTPFKNEMPPFWQWRDTRTFLHTVTGDPNGHFKFANNFKKIGINAEAHNALHDCAMDAIRIFFATSDQDELSQIFKLS